MPENDNIFTLRFFGNDVTPESFSAKELGQLIISIYEGLKEIIDVRYPDINPDDVKLSLVAIENQSESLVWSISEQPQVRSALNDLGKAVEGRTYTDLPKAAYSTVKQIHGISKRKNCNAELISKGERLFVVTPDDYLIKQENVLVKSNMVLYGVLNKIGGDKNRAWVELYDGSRISFPISDEQLVKLRGKTKEPIAVKGKATWNALTKKVLYFKIKEVIEYNAGEVSDGFEAIRNITSGGWDKLNNNQDLTNFLKGEA